MKFAREYRDFLKHGGFPEDWVNSAISYGQLKKCIKRVKNELASIGLTPETLRLLLERAENAQRTAAHEAGSEEPSLRYEFGQSSDATASAQENHGVRRPKLLFLIDEVTGEAVDARLSPETKLYIHELALSEQLTNVHLSSECDGNSLASTESRDSAEGLTLATPSTKRPSAGRRLVEVPLTSDSEFFDMLQNELSGLAHIQDEEKSKIHNEITVIGNSLVKAIDTKSKSGRADLEKWRRIFELYMDSRIFFAMAERDHGIQKFSAAQDRYNAFLSKAKQADLLRKFKRKESMVALQHFLHINVELLQNLRFQEINQTAMVKILKKFDKRTSLGARTAFSSTASSLTPARLSSSLSQALSQEITTRILSTIPSLDDYSCPICADLAWRPVRLPCSHIFCIRCLIRLQREKKTMCPLCREDTVLKADSTSIDEGLIRFMKEWFPKEVDAKQKVNEKLAFEERFGKALAKSQEDQCVVM